MLSLRSWRARLERQAFPILVASDVLAVPPAAQTAFLGAFFSAGSSILALDAWLDQDALPTGGSGASMFCALLGATAKLCDLERGKELVRRLHHDWFVEASTMENEYEYRHHVPAQPIITRLMSYYSGILPQPLHSFELSIGRYFTTVVGCSCDLAGIRLPPSLERLCDLFNVIRQIADDVADVREDLHLGRPTLPVLFAIQNGSFRRKVTAAWQARSVDDQLFSALVDTGALEQSADLADTVWQEAASLIGNNCHGQGLGIPQRLAVFFHLKRAAIERLRLNAWHDPMAPYFA